MPRSTIATWNIQRVRLREDLVARVMDEGAPGRFVPQECKARSKKNAQLHPSFKQLCYRLMPPMRGQKGL